MSFQRKKIILLIAMTVLILMAWLFSQLGSGELLFLVFIPLLIVWVVLCYKWWRCPHCGRSLGRIELGVSHCKYCGHELSDE